MRFNSCKLRENVCALAMAGLLGLSPAAAQQRGDRISGRQVAGRSEVIARHGMAATSQPLCTQVALDILKAGGTAVDAAIAANACLGLMEPTGSGIGGDLFAIVWDGKTKKLHGLNASGRSPYGLSLEELRRRVDEQPPAPDASESQRRAREVAGRIPAHGPLPVTVPGCVDGWEKLHKKFGKLPLSQVLAPAVQYAREGFPVSELIAYYWSRSESLGRFDNFAKTYLKDGKAPAKGDVFRNPDLANTLETIGKYGADAFYRGPLTGVMVKFFEREGCYLRARDFNEHTSTWVEPVLTSYRGYDAWELPPNGQGIAALQILNMIEPYNLSAMGHNSAEYLHLLVEAKKLAYEDRARFYADPDFYEVPIARLISKDYAAARMKLFDPKKALPSIDPGDPILKDGDTIYLTVADKDRNMVSLIQSNYRGFGSGLVPDGLGFCLQDRGQLFSLQDGHPNVYAPHKRPFHTIIPAFVTKDGKPFMSFGVMGGDMQPQGHVQILGNVIDFGMNLQEAGDAARFHHTESSEPTGYKMQDGGELALESGIGDDVRRKLAAMGHRIATKRSDYGGCQAILYDAERDVYVGASEFRKDGQAAGY